MNVRKVKKSSTDFINEEFDISPQLKRFNQKNDIFSRAIWDEKVNPKKFFLSYDIANYTPKKAKGFDHWDYAFRNASWHLTDVIGERDFETKGTVEGFTDYYTIQTESSPSKVELTSIEDTTNRVKLAAKMFGAGMVGVCNMRMGP